MSPDPVRAMLLRQHAELRVFITEIQGFAQLASKGTDIRDSLHLAVIGLTDALARHHAFEEDWLRTLDPQVDGRTRAEIDVLLDAHVREHEELFAVVAAIPDTPTKFAGVDVTVLLEGILEHMADEERTLLEGDLGRDHATPAERAGH